MYQIHAWPDVKNKSRSGAMSLLYAQGRPVHILGPSPYPSKVVIIKSIHPSPSSGNFNNKRLWTYQQNNSVNAICFIRWSNTKKSGQQQPPPLLSDKHIIRYLYVRWQKLLPSCMPGTFLTLFNSPS